MKNNWIESKILRISCLTLLSYLLISCAGTPSTKEYSLAKVAIDFATKYSNQSKALQKSNSLYNKGERAFKNRYYGQAERYFQDAMELAEGVENKQRLQRYKKGDFSL